MRKVEKVGKLISVLRLSNLRFPEVEDNLGYGRLEDYDKEFLRYLVVCVLYMLY